MNTLFGEYNFKFLQQELLLLPQKALLWKNKSTLILADVHFGKAGHFRKAGIPIPHEIHQADLYQLESVIKSYKIKKLIFLGDLFHSIYNEEWDAFTSWLDKFSELEVILVKGNHDILPDKLYQNSILKICDGDLVLDPFILSHIPLKKGNIKNKLYNLSGHIHPSFTITGKGRQSITLPCFYFGNNQGILPAFGNFTGSSRIYMEEGDKVYLVADGKIISI